MLNKLSRFVRLKANYSDLAYRLNSNLYLFKNLLYECYDVDYEQYGEEKPHYIKRTNCNKERYKLLTEIEEKIFYDMDIIGSDFHGFAALDFYRYLCKEHDAICLFCGKASENIEDYIKLPPVYPVFPFDEHGIPFDFIEFLFMGPNDRTNRTAIGVAVNKYAYEDCFSTIGIDLRKHSYKCKVVINRNYQEKISFVYKECREIANFNNDFAKLLYYVVLSFLHISSYKSRHSTYLDFIDLEYKTNFMYDYHYAPLLYNFSGVADCSLKDFRFVYKKLKDILEICINKFINDVKKDLCAHGSPFIMDDNFSPLCYFDEIYELVREEINSNIICPHKFSINEEYDLSIHMQIENLLFELEEFFIEEPFEI